MSEPAQRRPRKDRVIAKIVAVLVRMLYEKVEVFHAEGQPETEPQLSVANHFGGFADPLILMAAMPRRPRIIARDVIWRIPIAGWVMKWLEAVPVHKPEDKGPNRNDQMFASAYEALEGSGHLMIFPEGITVDDPQIAQIKTGAARIALGSRANGSAGLHITPAGIHYEDKAALRSRVSVYIGAPLDLDSGIGSYIDPGQPEDASNREAVRRLTADIEARLRRSAPNFENWREAHALTEAAEILLRSKMENPRHEVSISERDRIASVAARAPAEQRSLLIEAVDAYRTDLAGAGISDAEMYRRRSTISFFGYQIWNVILGLILLPLAIIGALVNVLPFLAVKALNFLRVSPAVLATLKPLAAIVTFGIAWGLTAWATFREFGLEGAAAAILLMPVCLFAVIVLSERVVLAWRALRVWFRGGRAEKLQDQIVADRQRVIEALAAAL